MEVADFTLAAIQTDQELKDWTTIVQQQLKTSLKPEYLQPLLSASNLTFLVGKYRGEVVSTALLFLENNHICGIHMVATKGGFEKQGIGKWTFYQAIQMAFKMGASWVFCAATPAGVEPWKKLGFQVYTKLYLYWCVGKAHLQK